MIRKTLKWCTVGSAIALAMAAGIGPVALADDDDAARAAQLVKSGDIMPLEQIVQKAQAVHAGKVLESDLDHERGRYVYEIEVLDDQGVVWEMDLDARTGEVLESKRDD
jgi:uncharacterized membrane protein YkoI